jgi:penicillin-binding protein 1C
VPTSRNKTSSASPSSEATKLASKLVECPQMIKKFLAAIGKPIYFILSRIFIAIIFVMYLIKDLASSIQDTMIRAIVSFNKRPRKQKKRVKKNKRVFLKLKPILLPKFPNLVNIFKLESLRISLFEIKVLLKIKRFFNRKITRFQKLKLKKRLFILGSFLLVFSFAVYFYFFIIKTLPSPSELIQRVPQVSTKIYDRNGVLLYKIYKDQNRTLVPLSQIPIHVRLATLAAEDAEFYNHPGFSLKGIFRAILEDLQTGSLQGGSTITQQLVKNVLLTPEKTIMRKIKEIILSIEVEATYTKDQILEMYLNQVSFGGTSYGIEEASQEYFGKNVEDLDLAEATFLAGLPKSPTAYSPYGSTPELGIQRQRDVIHLMVVNKFITQAQANSTEQEKLTFSPRVSTIKAPHFVMYIRSLLVAKYGEEMVEKGGLEVITSLDYKIQSTAEKIVQDEVNKLKGLNVGNGDALVMIPKTGEILAMVGSKDYFDAENDGQVNVLARLRQPGSSIKVVNYAYALSKGGYTPATIINDSPITYNSPGSPPYSPVNYDGQYRGNITIRSALAQSRNIPAVKILASYGVDKMIDLGREMGISSWNEPNKYGLALTLGGGAVTGLDLAKVYATIANNGQRPDIEPILQIKDYKGKILFTRNTSQNNAGGEKVLDPRVAFLLTDILKDNYARAPEFGLSSYLVIKNHPEVAVKTGTSNDLRDNWTVGYNQNYLVLTWVGNNDNSPMSRIASGVTGASPIWNKIMSSLLADQVSIDWLIPDGVVKINCPGGKSEWFAADNVLPNYCSPPPSLTPIPQESQSQILDGASTVNP